MSLLLAGLSWLWQFGLEQSPHRIRGRRVPSVRKRFAADRAAVVADRSERVSTVTGSRREGRADWEWRDGRAGRRSPRSSADAPCIPDSARITRRETVNRKRRRC